MEPASIFMPFRQMAFQKCFKGQLISEEMHRSDEHEGVNLLADSVELSVRLVGAVVEMLKAKTYGVHTAIITAALIMYEQE